MSNYLKSEFYKLTHRAYPYVLLIICTVIAILINLAVWYSQNIMHIPFYIDGSDLLMAGLYIMANIICYMVIFTTDIGFSGEWRNNTMKNCVSFGVSRNTIFTGKCIINFIILFIGIIIVSGAYILTNYICFKSDESLTSDIYMEYFLRFLLMLPLIIAIQTMASSLCMFFSTDLLWCGIYAVVIAFLPNGLMLLRSLFDDVEALQIAYSYMPTTCLSHISFYGFNGNIIQRSLSVSAVVFIIPFVSSILVFNRKEIK
ncbi:MAG: ABC transporter permease [Coprococcus sp.]